MKRKLAMVVLLEGILLTQKPYPDRSASYQMGQSL